MLNSLASIPLEPANSDPFGVVSALLKAAADPLRLEILRVLSRGSYGVLELCQILDCKQPALSHHLKVLASAELVATRREGNSIYYRRAHLPAKHPRFQLQQALFTEIDGLPLGEPAQLRLRTVQEERAQASQDFFTDNADKFREQQDLIASFPVYADQVQDMLKKVLSKKHRSVLEVGPGDGELLPILVKQFDTVIALDNSELMLDKAKQLAQSQELNSVQFYLGDTKTVLTKNVKVDCIIMNMVLHHAAEPSDIFADLSQALSPGGILLITDLCRHQQQWASESCGDLWLGFEPQDFSQWASAASLEEGQSSYFALRNGFQIQLRHFFKTEAA